MKKQFLTYQELNEALKLSQYRDYHDIRPKNIEDKLSELFKGKNRIYIPFEYKVTKKNIKLDYTINAVLNRGGYAITDYLEGYCEKDGRTFRIGKILNQLNRPDLLKTFNEDPQRAIQNKNFLICISKHPYDIAGMSTDRGWTSCMDLKSGTNTGYIEKEIEEGTLIAYLINAQDKNINRPYGRINIKPYKNENDDMAWGLASRCYGSILNNNEDISKKFQKVLNTWVTRNLNKKKTGLYKLNDIVYGEAEYIKNFQINKKINLKSFSEKDRRYIFGISESENYSDLFTIKLDPKSNNQYRTMSLENFMLHGGNAKIAEWYDSLDDVAQTYILERYETYSKIAYSSLYTYLWNKNLLESYEDEDYMILSLNKIPCVVYDNIYSSYNHYEGTNLIELTSDFLYDVFLDYFKYLEIENGEANEDNIDEYATESVMDWIFEIIHRNFYVCLEYLSFKSGDRINRYIKNII